MAYAGESQVWVTTANNFEGYRITRYLGIVRGITVRSRGAIGQIGAGFQRIVGGNITLYTEMCEHARDEAFQLLDQGTTEVLAYGTAAIIEVAAPQ
jgi:uncharacterized protein YbjQ (UPF0145 family)